jgi:predicted P-loop ATPase
MWSVSAAPDILNTWGDDLTAIDLAKLAARWITPELAELAGIRRVDSVTGCSMFNRKRDMAGLIIPNVFPGTQHVRDYRLRLDHPDFEIDVKGNKRESGMKYIGPTDRPPLIYFPTGITPEMLTDVTLPVIITEGEFKAIALWRLANHESNNPRFVPIAVQGVDCWRGTIGHTNNASGKRVAIKGVLPDLAERMVWKGRQVVIAYDADIATKDTVEKARARLTYALIERLATVGFLEWAIAEGKGIDDRLANIGPEPVLADIATIEFGGWRSRLLRNADGKLITCYENVALHLENSPEWVGVLAYNEFTGGHVILRQGPVSVKPGEEIEDHFDTEVTRWLERHHLMAKPDMARKVVDTIARKNSFHPVRDYLESLPAWDGTERIGTWLIEYCGVQLTDSDGKPNTYAMVVGAKFLISAVARIMEPGCKADHLLILEGPQGIGKSRAARTLAVDEQWFTSQLADMGSQNSCMQLRGRWIVELGELDALNRADMSRAKAFLGEQSDKFRLPYGHRILPFPRSCVFIGTTNQDTWLKDETGGRRFWPVRCGQINLIQLAADRDQLWAEALHRYRNDEHWWIEDDGVIEQAKEEQGGRYMPDPWHDKVIAAALDIADLISSGCRAGSAAVPEILDKIGVKLEQQDQRAANRVAHCLKFAKWERKKVGPRGDREWRYVKPMKS